MYSCNKNNIGSGDAPATSRPTVKPIANSVKPAAASTTTPKRPVVNFLGNLFRPRKDEDSDDERLDAVEEDSSNTID